MEKHEAESNNIKTELKKLKSQNRELKDENHQLEVGLREVLGQLRENPTLQSAAGEVSRQRIFNYTYMLMKILKCNFARLTNLLKYFFKLWK